MSNTRINIEEQEFQEFKKELQTCKKKLEQIDTRLTLVEYQIVAIQDSLKKEAEKIVAEKKLSSIVPEPAKGEKEYLNSLLKDEVVSPWRINLNKVEQQTLNGLVDLLADSVIKVYNWNQEDKKISEKDHEKFLKSFVDKLVDSSFAGDSNSNPKLMGVEAGVKALVIAGKYMIAKLEEQKKNQDLINYWNQKKKNLIKSEIKKYLKDESEKGFEEMLSDFCNLYQINFDRDDCKFDLLSFNESSLFNKDSPFFQRSFKNISDYVHQTPVDSERSFELNNAYHSSGKIEKTWKFNYINFYASKEISQKDLERLNSQFNSFHSEVKSQTRFQDGPISSWSSHEDVYKKMFYHSQIKFNFKENISEEEIKDFKFVLKLKANFCDKKKNKNDQFDLFFYSKDDLLQEELDQLIYHFECYKDYNQNYSKLNYQFDIEINKLNENKLKSEIESYTEISAKKFNIKDYAKDEISEDELQKLNSQFRLYRAIKKTGEFNYQSNSNDVFYRLQEGFAYANHAFGTLPMILLFPYIAVPTYFGGRILSNNIGADQNLLNERYFRENISNLTENMRKCMFGFSSETFNEVLKKREILSHIKIFADITGSKYAEHFYQECLKDSYAGIEKKELFDKLYDLYSKLTNTGLANPENHYKYSFQLQQIESTEIENPALKFVLSAIERNKKKAQGLFDQVVNENPANDQSFLFGSSQVLKTALGAWQNS